MWTKLWLRKNNLEAKNEIVSRFTREAVGFLFPSRQVCKYEIYKYCEFRAINKQANNNSMIYEFVSFFFIKIVPVFVQKNKKHHVFLTFDCRTCMC